MVEPPRSTRPRRIAVVGRAGSGKSTTSVALGAGLGLPVVHLDQLYWTSDWQPVPAERFDALHDAAIAEDAWVLDGGYFSARSFGGRIRRADLVVVTKAPLLLCLYRVVRRAYRYRGRERADRPDGADERLSLEFLVWIVRWTWKHRHIEAELRAHDPDVPIVVVRNDRDIEQIVAR